MENVNNVQPAPAARGDQSKLFSILAYIPLLFLIGLFVAPEKNNPFVKNHVNNGLIITILCVVSSILSAIGSGDAATLKFICLFIAGLIDAVVLTLVLFGIIESSSNKYYKLPIVGDSLTFIK